MSKCSRHGISIGVERIDSEFFLYFKAIGRLTHDDYAQITPLIDFALQEVKAPQVKALMDIREFEGWELRAAWDDFKLGLKHGNEFIRVALLGDEKWQKTAARIANWFIAGEVRYFEDHDEALDWLSEPQAEDADKTETASLWQYPTFPPYQ
ncbi:SpoIIAA family protein [Microbulbifer hainanensis]|uniref:STAS/SEC14 domain-containing protein n=1 Tax=Microbulbifer hainanensis TaxID=2735675 RepID=UPI0018682A19|nr:STAS/SEC14 domain-containing protein [Microbulbifer hainanensis]